MKKNKVMLTSLEGPRKRCGPLCAAILVVIVAAAAGITRAVTNVVELIKISARIAAFH